MLDIMRKFKRPSGEIFYCEVCGEGGLGIPDRSMLGLAVADPYEAQAIKAVALGRTIQKSHEVCTLEELCTMQEGQVGTKGRVLVIGDYETCSIAKRVEDLQKYLSQNKDDNSGVCVCHGRSGHVSAPITMMK